MPATIDDMTSEQAASVRRNFWKTVKRAARQVPFMEDVVAAYYCAFDRETPLQARAILLGALAYFVMPFDVLPDVIALVGFTDDVAGDFLYAVISRDAAGTVDYVGAVGAVEVEVKGGPTETFKEKRDYEYVR